MPINGNLRFLDAGEIVAAFAPVDMSASSGPTSDWVCMKNYSRLTILYVAAVGTTANDSTITVEQATSDGGTAKALTFTEIDYKQGLLLSAIEQFTHATQTAASTYTSATSGEEQCMWVIDIKAEDLDIDGGYDWVRASINDHGAAKVGVILYLLHGARYDKHPGLTAIA